MSLYLLDVNLLLALCDPHHVHHESAHQWFETRGQQGWATCPITENGFARVAAQPAYPSSPGGPAVVRDLLTRFCAHPHHHFWPDDISWRDEKIFQPTTAMTPGQLTDIYLLGLAVHHGGKLATLDRRVPVSMVKHGAAALELLPG
jgi:toxin-antitoxin system PIN domain toxin